ncbi:hypothetical protein JDN40_05045 [Rhodomicrobium vannielii ATCC 17100]|uniref:hypothetical protein n=1 Tax=Rhodomicrobium vannielii TaxID=1069 RepID=UPI00191A939E|nr:hypothetical protein [Rhodomicrobium vannielii]MBJ7533471.1 hypothetical protein [Rhodomicrobium vannielii ATCC 17100]
MQRHYLDALPDAAIRADLVAQVAGLRAVCAEWGVPVFASMVPEAHGLQERGLMSELWGVVRAARARCSIRRCSATMAASAS